MSGDRDAPAPVEERRVYRGEQFPSTPGQLPTRGLLATIVGRKTACYTVTPPPARRELRPPAVPRHVDLTLRTSPPNLPRPGPVKATCPHQGGGTVVLTHSDSDTTSIRSNQSSSSLESYVGSALPPPSPGYSCGSSKRPLASVEALVRFSCTSLLAPDSPQMVRSNSWVANPSEHVESIMCLHQRGRSDSGVSSGTVTPSIRYAGDYSILGASCNSLDTRCSSADAAGSKRCSVLQRSLSYSERRGSQEEVQVGDTNCIGSPGAPAYNCASLGRPIKKKHNLSLQDNVQQYKTWLKADTPKTGKGRGFIRQSCQSFRKGLPKMKPSPTSITKTSPLVKSVNVIGHSGQTNEGLKRAVEDVQRALQFYQDTVVKQITDMLPGSATVVLDMVLSLSLAIDEAYSRGNKCQRMAELQRGLHQSLADLVRWSDHFLLHGADTPHTTTVHAVVGDVRNAVQALVDVATKEDILQRSDDPASPQLAATRHPPREGRLHCPATNRNSLPEICTHSPPPSPTPVRKSSPNYRSTSLQRSSPSSRASPSPISSPRLTPSPPSHSPCSSRLSHSLSSDSILHPGGGGEGSPCPAPVPAFTHQNSPSLTGGCGLTHQTSAPGLHHSITHSLEVTSPPPLPPKRRSHNRSSSSTCASPLYSSVSPLTTPCLLKASPSSTSSRNGSLGRLNSETLSCSAAVTSASSDALNGSRDALNGSLARGSSDALSSRASSHNNGLDAATESPCRLSAASTSVTNTSSPSQMSPASSLDSFNANESFRHSLSSPHEAGSIQLDLASSLTNNFSLARSSGQHEDEDSRSQRFSHITQFFPDIASFASSSSQFTNVSQSASSEHSAFSSHVSQGEGPANVHSLSVPPQLPAKQRLNATPSDSPPPPVRLREKLIGDPSPELPPKKSNSMSSGYFSSSNSSMLSNSSTSSSNSSGVALGFISTTVVRRHTATCHTALTDTVDGDGDKPPSLPPKARNKILEYMTFMNQGATTINEFRHSLQSSPLQHAEDGQLLEPGVGPLHHHYSYTPDTVTNGLPDTIAPAFITETPSLTLPSGPPPALPPKRGRSLSKEASLDPGSSPPPVAPCDSADLLPANRNSTQQSVICAVGEEDRGVLELLDAEGLLQRKKESEDGPDIKGGSADALVVHACTVLKTGHFHKDDRTYQEAFLTTYRTFVTPDALVEKLLYRYHKFIAHSPTDRDRQIVASNAFSLLVCVVEDLAIGDLNKELLQTLSDFQHELLCKAQFKCAKMLRTSLVKKLEARKRNQQPRESLASMAVTTKQLALLDFKAQEIAEQMTLLDAELFHKVEIPEVLIWSQEQNEERSPNLTTFTEHFNKMSYWVRTRILDQTDSRDREKYVMKFIKILKHLRKLNNFNSYLALLSALDSAPIRRLEWQKTITDGLKEYCALIDSSSSFRAYRNALAESSPPCIPYIGLILQDLTFVNIGNSDTLSEGEVNFSKRWQQFHILDNMKRFRKSNYAFKKKERIIEFFNDFEDGKNEDVLWEMSKQIKPSGAKRLH